MRRALLLVAVAACGSKSAPAHRDAGAARPDAMPGTGTGSKIGLIQDAGAGLGTGAGSGSGSGSDQPRGPVTLDRLEPGDETCQIDITLADGGTMSLAGVDSLCPDAPRDASELIGQPVMLGYRDGQVISITPP